MAQQVAAASVRGSFLSTAASAFTLALGFGRSVVLARFLAPEDFGAVSLALFFLSVIGQVTDVGFGRALIHRQEDVEEASATYFAIRSGMGALKVVVALAIAPMLGTFYQAEPHMVQALLALAVVDLVRAFNATPTALMTKELDFRRLAVLDVVSSISMTAVALTMVWAGFGFWSLVGEQAGGVAARAIVMWGLYRPWKPRWRVNWSLAKWYLQFGIHLFLTGGLGFLLDRFDDFWTGTTLGLTALGFYSRAYEYARYPRRVVANPIVNVFFPTYAKVQKDREHLSKAFFRASSLITRAGFLFSGVFAVVAPEFVRLFPGEKWLPMVTTFRLMLVYILFDPLLVSANNLAIAVGRPQILSRTRAIQLAVFVPLVVLLARYYAPWATAIAGFLGVGGIAASGIDGVAIAADVMLFLGTVLTFRAVRPFVDFSLRRMFGWPLVGAGLAVGAVLGLERAVAFPNQWAGLLGKASLFCLLYVGVLVLAEWREYTRYVRMVGSLLRRSEETPG